MKKRYLISLVSSVVMSLVLGIGLVPSLLKNGNPEGVGSSSVPYAEGPMFYAAGYSTDFTAEPSYPSQVSYTYSCMDTANAFRRARGENVKVAIIDSGINYEHEDFLLDNSSIVKSDSQTISYEYYSGKTQWWWFNYNSFPQRINDTLGHGTNVASVIASQINSLGCAGLAPNVDLYIYKVTNSNDGYEWTAISQALDFCINNGIDVVNMSFQAYEKSVTYGGSTMPASTGCSTVLSNKLTECYNAGITLVAAAGNYNTSEPSYPASNNHVISVGSLAESSTTTKAGYSNTYGIDLVAPGTVYVADKGGTSSYKKTQGTSFSSPLVTAAIALYKQLNPSATPAQIESALYASCDSISGNPSWAGHGRLNLKNFLGIANAPTDIVVNNSEVVDDVLNLEAGETFDINQTVYGNGTFSQNVNYLAFMNDGTLSVNEDGRIYALSEGEDLVIIKSTQDPEVFTQIDVTVSAPSGGLTTVSAVEVSPSSLNLDVYNNKTGNLSATVYGKNSPSQSVNWTSSNTSVATVSNSGVVTAKGAGDATITATSTIDPTKSDTCTVHITNTTPTITSVSLSESTLNLIEGAQHTLTATVNGTNNPPSTVSWESSNTSVATVSDGVVSALSSGTTTITATSTFDQDKSASCTVNVSTSSSETITFSEKGYSDQAVVSTVAGTNFSVTFDKGTNSNTPKYYNSGSAVRIYGGGYFTVASSKTIIGITLTFGTSDGSNAITTNVGTYDNGTWSGSANSIKFTIGGSSGHRRIAAITVTYSGVLQSISVLTPPDKTTYLAGEYFDPTALVITKSYSDSSSENVEYLGHESDFSFSPSLLTALTTSDIEVTITCGGKSCSQAIVVKQLSSITISGYKTSFVEGDAFVFGGTVTAHYSDTSSSDVTSLASFTGYNMATVDNQTVTVTYSNQSTTYNISIEAGTLSSISVSGQTTSYHKNNAFSFDGICTATFENGYQKVVTPTSVTSPDMSIAGNKTITVSYTYNGTTKSTTYEISVSAQRTVIEVTSTKEYAVIGTITYPSNTQTISNNTLSVSTSGYTTIESNSIRLGSGSNTGTVTVISTTSNITKVVVSAKRYGSDSSVNLAIGGSNNTITSSYADYVKEFTTGTNSVSIATTANSKRAYVQSITVYKTVTIQTETDISTTDDCVGLETFITNCMHMDDYTENLGYCKDIEHHYYSTAKTAFNNLNTHQRSLFTSNSAYANEWARLSNWASFNGDTLNGSNQLSLAPKTTLINSVNSDGSVVIIVIISIMSLSALGGYIYLKRRKED